MTPEEADRINAEEAAAERADLMKRALVYAAEKRAEETARAIGIEISPAVIKTLVQRHESDRIRDEAKAKERAQTALAKKVHANKGRPSKRRQFYPYKDEVLTIEDIAQRSGCSLATAQQRIRKGWSVDRIIANPPNPNMQRAQQLRQQRARGGCSTLADSLRTGVVPSAQH